MAWTHQFRNSIQGSVLQIPHEFIKLDAQTDSIIAGVNVQFGKPRKRPDNAVSSDDAAPPLPTTPITPVELPPQPDLVGETLSSLPPLPQPGPLAEAGTPPVPAQPPSPGAVSTAGVPKSAEVIR